MSERRRDRLRELLDAVLAESAGSLTEMADHAYASRFHFARQVTDGAGESPVALRRRVALERAAWRLRRGRSVTEAAWEAGYESVEGFARAYRRAYGFAPSETPADDDTASTTGHWLSAPNGIHFHAPDSLWVTAASSRTGGGEQVTALLAHHDVADVRRLLERARELTPEQWTHPHLPGLVLLNWFGPEESIAALLTGAVVQVEAWLAAIEGSEQSPHGVVDEGAPGPSPGDLLRRWESAGPRWSAMIDEVEERAAWGDRLIDALCDPPESFVLGSVLAHALTYNAQRRGLARALMRRIGALPPDDDGDPIVWLREQGADGRR
ncbi:MAG: helix-turn-helix transcriptional regulator [Gordonia sp. (in: high G+C Gram-positive bacteria)]|uniref:helix-turn-helix domain-containing protein n=1 Tax=Gordonia sp. (in: high G+C Gram-positive bacteria) TaxID=84139 RepID=UPI0039E46A20